MANVSLDSAMRTAVLAKDELHYPPDITDMSSMSFVGKDMSKIAKDKVMKHTDFSDADLSGADFKGFNLQGCIFRRTILNGTNFANADLRWSIIEQVETDEASNFDGADLREVVRN